MELLEGLPTIIGGFNAETGTFNEILYQVDIIFTNSSFLHFILVVYTVFYFIKTNINIKTVYTIK